MLLDLCSAFDTVDHVILLRTLHDDFGARDSVLSWFATYFSCRSQRVSVKGMLSDVVGSGGEFLKAPALAHCCFLSTRVSFLMLFIHIFRPYTLLLLHGQKFLTFEPAWQQWLFPIVLNMAHEIPKLCMRSDGITGNARTITVVFQFAKIEHYSTTFQRHIGVKNLCEN